MSGPGWSLPPTPSSEGLDPPLGCFCEDPPLYVRAWMIAAPPPPSSEVLDPPLGCFCEDPPPLYVRAWMIDAPPHSLI